MAGMTQIIIKTDNPMKNRILNRFERLQKEVWDIKFLIKFSFTSNLCFFFLQCILPFRQKGFNLKQEVPENEIFQTFTVL